MVNFSSFCNYLSKFLTSNKNLLTDLNVPEQNSHDILNFLLENKTVAHIYLAALKNNPNLTADELKKIEIENVQESLMNIEITFENTYTIRKIMTSHNPKIQDEKVEVYSLIDDKNNSIVMIEVSYDETTITKLRDNNDDNPKKYNKYVYEWLKIKTSIEYYKDEFASSFGLVDIKQVDISRNEIFKKIINRRIINNLDPPSFSRSYCKNILKSNKIPSEWLNGIAGYILEKGDAPEFANDYLEEIIYSKKIPQEILNAINKFIELKGNCPGFCTDYCRKILESGKFPKEWINYINNFIEKNGIPPNFAQNYYINLFNSKKEIPQEYMIGISKYIEANGNCPHFAEEYCKRVLESGNGTKEWILAINKYIETNNAYPKFAEEYYKTLLEGNIEEQMR